MGAPPVLQRGVSSVYTGGPAGDGSGHGEDVPLPPFTETAQSREVEQSVRTVLAKKFRPVRDGAVLGFPAYDAEKNLVGLYRDQNGPPITPRRVLHTTARRRTRATASIACRSTVRSSGSRRRRYCTATRRSPGPSSSSSSLAFI